MSEIKHTPLPWLVHSHFYTHGIKGDIFAKDAQSVRDATPICRVVSPVSFSANRQARPPIDELHAIAMKNEEVPIIEANAAFIVEACNTYYENRTALAAKDAEIARLRERLAIGPQGEDAIDVAESAAEHLHHRIATLEEALKPFVTEWADDDGWSETACQKDRVVDWFGPSDFRRARAALKEQTP